MDPGVRDLCRRGSSALAEAESDSESGESDDELLLHDVLLSRAFD